MTIDFDFGLGFVIGFVIAGSLSAVFFNLMEGQK